MKSFLKWSMYCLVALLVIVFFFGEDKKSAKQQAVILEGGNSLAKNDGDVLPEAPALKISVLELFNGYEENEVAMDERINGRILEVSGTIHSIDKDFSDAIVIKLRTSNEFMSASMRINDEEKDKAMRLKKGTQIKLRCPSMSRLMGSPSGRNCSII